MSPLVRNPQIICREEEEGKYLVFNAENCLPLVMNGTSHFIWSLCDGKHDMEAIKAELLQQFDFSDVAFSTDQLESTVSEHLAILKTAQIVLEGESEAPRAAS